MFSRARTFMRIGGIPVRADTSWLIVLALLTWSFWTRFNLSYPAGTALVIGVIAAVLFSLSVIAHEIAHALEARHRGIPVGGITMYLFGGATEVYSDEVRRPGGEFALTEVGPWTSIVLASAFGVIAYVSGRLGVQWVADLCGELGWLNLLLGIFNLLPGAPLDGGRILAAIVWRITGDRWRPVGRAHHGGHPPAARRRTGPDSRRDGRPGHRGPAVRRGGPSGDPPHLEDRRRPGRRHPRRPRGGDPDRSRGDFRRQAGAGAEASAGTGPREARMRRLLFGASIGIVALALIAVPLNLVELNPGPALDVPSQIGFGGPARPVRGKLLLTTVTITQPSAVGALDALVTPHHELLWQTQVIPPGVNEQEYLASQVQVFQESAQAAAAVGLRAAG